MPRDPTRKTIIKGITPSSKKIKYLNQYELHTLLSSLDLSGKINWDWLIHLVAKTGMRFSERVCNFLWAARSRLIDVGGDSVTK